MTSAKLAHFLSEMFLLRRHRWLKPQIDVSKYPTQSLLVLVVVAEVVESWVTFEKVTSSNPLDKDYLGRWQ